MSYILRVFPHREVGAVLVTLLPVAAALTYLFHTNGKDYLGGSFDANWMLTLLFLAAAFAFVVVVKDCRKRAKQKAEE